jgi:hypothetical protein
MNLNALTLSELEDQQERLLNRLFRVRAAIQRQKGTESIPQQIARLPKRSRDFVSALWQAPGHRMKLIDLEEKVWHGKVIQSETVRRLAYDTDRRMENAGIPLYIDSIKRKNGDVMGYAVKMK